MSPAIFFFFEKPEDDFALHEETFHYQLVSYFPKLVSKSTKEMFPAPGLLCEPIFSNPKGFITISESNTNLWRKYL